MSQMPKTADTIHHATIAALCGAAAVKFGDDIAMSMAGGGSLTFRQVEKEARRFAAGLSARGFKQQDRAILHLPNSLEWVIAYYALAMLGAVVIPSNILLTPAEISWMTDDADASLIIVPGDRLSAILASGCKPKLAITLGNPDHTSGVPFDKVATDQVLPTITITPDDLWTIAYTSGTTGRSKGAMLSHGAVFDSTSGTATVHHRRRGDRVLSALPLPHVYGNIVMNCAFMAGMTLYSMPKFDAGEALKLLGSERITLFEGVPTMFYQLLTHANLSQTDFSALERCTVGGQTMPLAKIQAVEDALGCPLLELWGMSEVAGPATSSSAYWRKRPGSIGLAFPGLETCIVDLTDRRTAVGDNTPGELCIRGSQNMTGYWRNPKATAETIDENGWLHTGDVATRSSDGGLFIVDRLKDMIITAGYNIYPAELETVIAQHPSVAMVAVASQPDEEKGEIAKAFIVLKPGQAADADAILAHCRTQLAAYKCPRAIAFVDDLPQTSTGKIMRRALANK